MTRARRMLAPLLAGLLFAALRDAADGLASAAGSLVNFVGGWIAAMGWMFALVAP